MTRPPASSDRIATPPFKDGLGTRVRVTDAGGDPVEHLQLVPEVAAQESAIRDRVGRLINFRHARYVRLRGVDRAKTGLRPLYIAYDALDGHRLSTVLESLSRIALTVEVDVALQIVRDLLPAIGILHDSRKVTHGAIAPERLVYTTQQRLMIVDHGLGVALMRLNLPRKKLWEQFRIASPATNRAVFDEKMDVVQIGLVALALLLGRPLADEEYPAQVKRLIFSVKETSSKIGSRPIGPELRRWLERATGVDEAQTFTSIKEAQDAFETVVAVDRYAPTAAAVKGFFLRYDELMAKAAPAEREDGAAAIGSSVDVDEALSALQMQVTISPRRRPAADPAPAADAVEVKPARGRARLEPKPEPEAKTEAKTEAKADAKADAKVEVKFGRRKSDRLDALQALQEEMNAAAGDASALEQVAGSVYDDVATKAVARPDDSERVAREAAERGRQEAETREQAEREGRALAEQVARDAAEQVVRESAERAVAERQARAASEREAVERGARQEAERQAHEASLRATRETAEREAAERAARDASARAESEREARQRLERESQEAAERRVREQAERDEAERVAQARRDAEAREREARAAAEKHEAVEQARKEFAEREAALVGKARQEAAAREAELVERARQEAAAREAELVEKARQEAAAREAAERQAREQAEREARANAERARKEAAERAAAEKAALEAAARAEREAAERAAAERAAREAAERAEREAAERAAAERAAKEAAERAERVEREAAERAERMERESAERAERMAREAEERAERAAKEAAERAEREAAAREAAERQAQELAEREARAAERVRKEAADRAAAEEAAREAAQRAERESAERKAAERVAREAAERAAREASERAAAEQAAREAAEREAAHKAARELAERAVIEAAEREAAHRVALQAAEQAVREAAERAEVERAAREAAEQAAREASQRALADLAAQHADARGEFETAGRVAAERAAREAAEAAEQARQARAQAEREAREASERLQREAAERAAAERAAREHAARAEAEREARAQAEREARAAADRAERHAAERHAAERAAREAAALMEAERQARAAAEQAAREAADLAAREAANREAAERAARQAAELAAESEPRRRRRKKRPAGRTPEEADAVQPLPSGTGIQATAPVSTASEPSATPLVQWQAGQSVSVVPAWARGATPDAPPVAEPETASYTPPPSTPISDIDVQTAPPPSAPVLNFKPQTPDTWMHRAPQVPAAESDLDAESRQVPPGPTTAPRRSFGVNWARTLAATLLVALLEGVAFATAWWYVTPEQQGWLVIHTKPAGIQVSVDGAVLGKTPLAKALAPGRHTIELRYGTGTRVVPVEISAGVQTEQRISWGNAFTTGQASISSTNAGARVLIDGRAMGKTPLTVSDLLPGKHEVTVEEEKGSVSTMLMITAGQTTELDVPVYAGWASVLSPVQLDILLGGKLIGSTEIEKLMLRPGRHTLELVNESLGYRGSVEVRVRPGATTAVSVVPKTPVIIEAPEGTELSINGENMGTLPNPGLQVPLGTAEFVMRYKDEERRQVVPVTMSAPVTVKYELATIAEREPGR